MPYSKIAAYGITIEGLPGGRPLKHPSSYGHATLKEIVKSRENVKLKGNYLYILHIHAGYMHVQPGTNYCQKETTFIFNDGVSSKIVIDTHIEIANNYFTTRMLFFSSKFPYTALIL